MKTDTIVDIVGYRLRRAQISVFQRFMVAFADLALRPVEYSTMELIAENPGSKQADIARVLGLKRANFVVIVNQLQKRDLVERRSGSPDKRANALYLTQAGIDVFEQARQIQARFEQECIDKLGGEAETRSLLALLDRLIWH
jgi:DNA-binding MarR family transcriptional regulator